MEDYVGKYYDDNAVRLRAMVDRVLRKFGGITDYDHFYSLANEVFVDVLGRYDNKNDFDGFLYSCLTNRIKSEFTKLNRYKRLSDRNSISIDELMGDDDTTIADMIASDINIEDEVERRMDNIADERVEAFLGGLTQLQRAVLDMVVDEVPVSEIKSRLGLSDNQYENCLTEIKSYENIVKLDAGQSFLYKERMHMEREFRDSECAQPDECGIVAMSSRDRTKRDSNPILSYIKKMKKNLIRTDYCLQRNSGQWGNETRDELIATALNDLDIPYVVICQQNVNGQITDWLIDGLQRLTTFYNYHENIFKLGNKIEQYNIYYQEPAVSDDGNIILINKVCDIRGKYYRDLPDEVREMFDDYSICETKHLECTDEEIEYHIRRYNSSKQMNQAQGGMTYIGTQFGTIIKGYTRNHKFFKNVGNYKPAERRNGTLERIVSESVMAIYFMDDWKKKTKDLCWYLKKNATLEQFRNFEEILDRLSDVLTDDTAIMFNSRDSFLYFALFHRFIELNIDDNYFVSFLRQLQSTLHSTIIDGISFDSLNEKSTKDKKVIVDKLTLLDKLMREYIASRGIINQNCLRPQDA